MTYGEDGKHDAAYSYGIEHIMVEALDETRPESQDPLYYLYDGLGSVTYMVKPDGNFRDKYRYDAYGKPYPGDSKLSEDGRINLHNTYGYTGEMWDEETKLLYLRARYYEPATGRFLSRDSFAGEAQNPLSKNLYAYVQNNPVNGTDPTGHFVWFIVWGAYYAYSAYDSYNDVKTLTSPDATGVEKGLVTAGLLSNAVPGGKIAGKFVKEGGQLLIKHGDKLIKVSRNLKNSKMSKYVIKNGKQVGKGAGYLTRNVTKVSQLNKNLFKNLKFEGTIKAGGRSGGARPLTGTPNSFVKTQAGHKLVYDSQGRLIYDISPERIKMTVWDNAPNGNLFPRDVKLDGPVPKEFLQ